MNPLPAFRCSCGLILLLLLSGIGCSVAQRMSGPPAAKPTLAEQNETIRSVVEKLAVNVHELRAVYDELHIAARDALGGDTPDRQMDYVQKVYLHVNGALLVAEYQYQLMSVLNYIKDARRADYLTLRARGLDTARARMKAAIEYIDLYGAFITSPKATAAIPQARALIHGNIYLYDRLLDILKPLIHPAGAFTPDPYAPI